MDKEEDEIMVSMDGVMKSKAVPPPAEIIGTQFTVKVTFSSIFHTKQQNSGWVC